MPPKSSAGTTKSFRGSIFSRNKRLSYQTVVPVIPMVLTFSHPHQLFPMVLQRNPSIDITDGDDHSYKEKHHNWRTDSKRLKKRSSSFHRNKKPRIEDPPLPRSEASPDMIGIAMSGNAPPESAIHPSKGKHVAANGTQHQLQVLFLLGTWTSPRSRISGSQSLIALILPRVPLQSSPLFNPRACSGSPCKIWLVIAGLYRRASLLVILAKLVKKL